MPYVLSLVLEMCMLAAVVALTFRVTIYVYFLADSSCIGLSLAFNHTCRQLIVNDRIVLINRMLSPISYGFKDIMIAKLTGARPKSLVLIVFRLV